MKYLLICALIMCLSTVIPRIAGILLSKLKVKSRFLRSMLFYLPYAMISALTFPSIIFSTGNIITASVGTALTVVMSLFIKKHYIFMIILCVLVVFGIGFLV